MEKREWMYCHKPQEYQITCDKCNGTKLAWSEYKSMIWCYDCEVDTKGTGGIFDGPIPLGLCELMGISFNRIRLEDNMLLKMVNDNNKITYVEDKIIGLDNKNEN